MEEKKEQSGKESWLRKIAKFYMRHKTMVWTTGVCTAVAYAGYKIYNASTPSSQFVASVATEDVDNIILFGFTVAYHCKSTNSWHLSERSLFNDEELRTMITQPGLDYSCFPIEDRTVSAIFVGVVLPTFLMLWGMKKFILPPTGEKITNIQSREIVRFSDIGGNQSAKEAMLEISDCIMNPEKYRSLGIRLPKGVLLYGPPGTGKTLMAKALASEVNLKFLYASGADFVEIYAGVGPKRVKELFNNARSFGKCIIFIDEIDSLGGKRGKGNSCKEFDNTLNQLLTEMDGFNGSEGITVIAATNQEDMIDEALLRPGRFDRKVKIELPDLASRAHILAIHCQKRNKRVELEDLELFSQQMEGFTGAEIENVVNEAAFKTLQRLKQDPSQIPEISNKDISNAIEKALKEKDDLRRSKVEKEQVRAIEYMQNNYHPPKVISK